MERPAIIRHRLASVEEAAAIFGIPVSRVRTIERILLRSGQRKAEAAGNSPRTKKRAPLGTNGRKQRASKTK